MTKYKDITNSIAPIIKKLQKKYFKYIGHIKLKKIKVVAALYRRRTDYYAVVRYYHPAVKMFMRENIDYVIEICIPNATDLNKNQLLILLLHELMHIPVGGTDPDHANYLSIAEHDLEEFTEIMKLTGNFFNWVKDRNIEDILDNRIRDIKISKNGEVLIYE